MNTNMEFSYSNYLKSLCELKYIALLNICLIWLFSSIFLATLFFNECNNTFGMVISLINIFLPLLYIIFYIVSISTLFIMSLIHDRYHNTNYIEQI